MIKTDELVQYLNSYLKISEIPDVSKNGLQVQGKDEIVKIAFAVDACMDTFVEAFAQGAQMLIVHHGIFWNEIELLVGYHYKRIKFLLEKELNLYAVHLPLDVHPEVGNNVQLAKMLNLKVVGPFGEYQGVTIGIEAHPQQPVDVNLLTRKIQQSLNTAVRLDDFGPPEVERIGIITGGGASLIPQAVASGLDCYITGEPKHSFYHFGKETRINLIFAGHYATETLGVKALADHLAGQFGIATIFIDKPTGL